MMIEIKPTHFDKLAVESVRYCLGRMTYAVSECDEIIRRYWQHLSVNAKAIIQCDIVRKIKEHDHNLTVFPSSSYIDEVNNGYSVLGSEHDAWVWLELLNWIEQKNK